MSLTTPEQDKARRLARTILSDIFLYYKTKVKEGVEKDSLFEVLNEHLEEGKKLYLSRVDASVPNPIGYYNEAVVDILVKQAAQFPGVIW
jgi:hypothetical protein